MVSRTQWYARVNDAWPQKPPEVTADEATRAARKLYRFVMRKTWTGKVAITSGRRYSWIRRGTLYVNPGNGWRDLIHDMSHYFHWRTGQKPHAKSHARLELRLRREALRRGWLDGKLRVEEKSKPDPRTIRYQRTIAAIERWQAKLKRSQTALRKLRARKSYYEKTLAT